MNLTAGQLSELLQAARQGKPLATFELEFGKDVIQNILRGNEKLSQTITKVTTMEVQQILSSQDYSLAIAQSTLQSQPRIVKLSYWILGFGIVALAVGIFIAVPTELPNLHISSLQLEALNYSDLSFLAILVCVICLSILAVERHQTA